MFSQLLSQPAVRRIAAALGAENVRLIGGAVRDSLSGVSVKDLDMACRLLPEDSAARLKVAGIAVHETGLQHGTLTAVADGIPVEITTLRIDAETDGRHAQVQFTDDWQADAARRDFTFNALALDMAGGLHDYFSGQKDLQAGRVRFIGKASDRLQEDRLRALRFLRFFARFGSDTPDAETTEALSASASDLRQLSAERIWQELSRLLVLPRAAEALALGSQLGFWSVLFPDLSEGAERLNTVQAFAEAERFAPCPLRHLVAWLQPDGAAAARDLAQRLKLSNADKEHLVKISQTDFPAHQHEALYRYGPRVVTDRLLLAGKPAAHLSDWQRPVFPVTGADLLAAGLTSGPELGQVLKKLEQHWIDQEFVPDRRVLIALSEELRT